MADIRSSDKVGVALALPSSRSINIFPDSPNQRTSTLPSLEERGVVNRAKLSLQILGVQSLFWRKKSFAPDIARSEARFKTSYICLRSARTRFGAAKQTFLQSRGSFVPYTTETLVVKSGFR
jgi:hypothetical protein